jgi:hypothetical protein
MNNYKRKEVMDYLTRKPLSEQDLQLAYEAGQQTLDSIPETPVASNEERVLNRQPFYQNPPQLFEDDSVNPQVDGIPLYQGVKPGVAIEERMPIYLPPDMAPVMPQVPGIPDPQYKQLELATGGRVKFGEGSKLTGTDKTLEANIKEDHKAYNDYRKSIGSPTIPLDNEYIRMWIRSRLNSGGPVKNQAPKVIPMDLESVAFRLFQNNLDNLSYNQKQTVYNYIEDNRNKKADGGRIGFAEGTPMAGLVYVGSWEGPWTGPEFLGGPRKGQYYNAPGSSLTSLNVPRSDLYKTIPTNIPTTTVSSSELNSNLSLKDQYLNRLASLQSSGPQSNVDFKNLLESNLQKKATGGRVNLANGTEETYNPEIPSLGFSDPIDILEQQLINEKDSTKINALSHLLENAKKERKAKEMAEEEFKKSQKEKGIKYKEDFPSEAAYFAETAKQLLTNPKYTLGSFGKGAVQGTEFLVGQPLKTLFNQEGKNFEFYEPVLTKKLGIDKFVEENIPKGATTGTLFGGETIKTIGEFADPFLAYGLAKGAIKGAKPKPPTTAVDETIDPTRRDILKTGAVMGTGAVLYPTAKKLGMFDELAKGARAARVLPAVKGMPEWFSPLVSRIEREGLDITSQAKNAQKLEYEKLGKIPSNAADLEIVQSKKLEIPVPGKKELETITITEYKNGNIFVESNISGGAFDNPFDLYYTSPKEIIDETTKKKITKPGDFVVLEDRPQYASPKVYYDDTLELEQIELKIDDAISDLERLEKIATGKKPKPEQIKKRKENKEYVEKNPRDDADSRVPEPDTDYGYTYDN